MTEKYYIPDLSEFHVGFEYEYASNESWGYLDREFGKATSEWIKEAFSGGCVQDEASEVECIEGAIGGTKDIKIRVKCLDKEDIESLGWEFVPDDSQGDGQFRWYDLFKKNEFSISLGLDTNIIHKNRSIVFDGKIKNKSELHRIMKQIGITTN